MAEMPAVPPLLPKTACSICFLPVVLVMTDGIMEVRGCLPASIRLLPDGPFEYTPLGFENAFM